MSGKMLAIAAAFLLGSLSCAGIVRASSSNGTIDAAFSYARVCGNAACSDFGTVNWKPTGSTPVAIQDTGLSGYAWGDEIGWINLSPTGAGLSVVPATGRLSGYAYANAGGWINFNPTGATGTEIGVSINGSGEFSGWAWVSGAHGGWMKFDCGSAATCVKTDWRPLPYRSGGPGQPPSSGGSWSPPSATGFVLSGEAFPFARIVARKNGEHMLVALADAGGKFSFRVSGLQPGTHALELHASDVYARWSGPVRLQAKVAADSMTDIGRVFLSPSMEIDKRQMHQGERAMISGQSMPGAKIDITIASKVKKAVQVIAAEDGSYRYALEASGLTPGTYAISVRAHRGSETSLSGASAELVVEPRVEPAAAALAKPPSRITPRSATAAAPSPKGAESLPAFPFQPAKGGISLPSGIRAARAGPLWSFMLAALTFGLHGIDTQSWMPFIQER